MRKRLSTGEFIEGVKAGERGVLGRAITLAESDLPEDRLKAGEILQSLMPASGKSIRIAITGVPGAGKSTLIEALGKHLTGKGKKIAVLAVDPSSAISGGSILGDKTRMEELSKDPLAFIRPSPTGQSTGGITRRTRETILLCEAAGYEILLIETVGVGQIETQVRQMVDFFLLLMLTGAGDELQMIKKGVMEIADLIVVNKAEGANADKAQITKSEMEKALKDFPPVSPGWNTQVLTASAQEKRGMEEIWQQIENHHRVHTLNGYFSVNRQRQNIQWMHEYILELLEKDFYSSENVQLHWKSMEERVSRGKIPATIAAENLYKIFKSGA